jgi:hypothetical protein
MPVIGFLNTQSPEGVPHWVAAFRQGLKETGFVEGQNIAIEYRWAQGQYDRLPELTADLIRLQVAVIAATGGDPSPQVAKAATRTVPIVFTANSDPVRDGLVASLNRPGGNATGITIFGAAAVTKRLQLLHELVPQAAALAYLMNPNLPSGDIEMRAAETAAVSLGMDRSSRASQQKRPAHVRYGSGADITRLLSNVRFTPVSGQSADILPCPLCAISGLTHRSKKAPLFDHLVGEDKDRIGDRQSDRLRGFEIEDHVELRSLLHR